jgi:hypothetical protein
VDAWQDRGTHASVAAKRSWPRWALQPQPCVCTNHCLGPQPQQQLHNRPFTGTVPLLEAEACPFIWGVVVLGMSHS